jgi:hypothetical protein
LQETLCIGWLFDPIYRVLIDWRFWNTIDRALTKHSALNDSEGSSLDISKVLADKVSIPATTSRQGSPEGFERPLEVLSAFLSSGPEGKDDIAGLGEIFVIVGCFASSGAVESSASKSMEFNGTVYVGAGLRGRDVHVWI